MLSKTAKAITAVLAVIMILAWVTEEKYGISLLQYLDYSMPLTAGERALLEEKGTLVYGAGEASAPLSFVEGAAGQGLESAEREDSGTQAGESAEGAEDTAPPAPQGMIIDYMAYLADELGISIEAKPVRENMSYAEMRSGEIDVYDTYATRVKNRNLDFSQSFYSMNGIVETWKDSKIHSLEDLDGRTLIVQSSDDSVQLLSQNDDPYRHITIRAAKNIPDALEMLRSGEGDAVCGDEMVLEYYIKEMGMKDELRALSEPLYTKEVALAVTDGQDALLKALNKAVLRLKKANALTEIQNRWFGTSAMNFNDTSRYLWIPIFFVVLIGFTIVLYVWDAVLRRQIRRATREINEQKETLRTILDTVDAGLLLIDSSGTVMESNRGASEMAGTEYRDVLGQNIRDVALVGDLYERAAADDPAEDGEPDSLQVMDKGRYYDVGIRKIPSQDKQLVLVSDETTSVLAERKLRQENKMTAVGQLSTGLAHEIRNPLGLIRNYRYIIAGYATDDISRHAVEIIGSSVDRINGLIENLLNFSRLTKEESDWFDIRKTVGNVLLLEEKKAEAAGIRLTVENQAAPWIYSNEETIRLVLFNLINNALEALEKYQTEKEKEIQVSLESDGSILEIRVSDNGAGIREENLENIFNPFFSTKENGTGLGLYIVSSELEKVSGTISVMSREDEETCFTIRIPAQQREE